MQVRIAEDCLRSAGVSKFDVMVNATLGFVASGISDPDFFDSVSYMYKTSVESTLVTARLATTFLSPGGLLAMLGSVAALSPQPKMLGFSASKAAVHQMVRSLAVAVGDELPAGSAVVALVPEVLDTPLHRSMNQGRAGPNWTPCDAVASKLLHWATEPASRPPNASLVSVSTSQGQNSALEHQFRLIQNPSFVQSTVF
jgi:dihydropteridine reductase